MGYIRADYGQILTLQKAEGIYCIEYSDRHFVLQLLDLQPEIT